MFKGHPKGLIVAFLANMGERFGFYTMISIFVLFLQAKYGLNATAAGLIYSNFMVSVYLFPLLGGFLADRYLGYATRNYVLPWSKELRPRVHRHDRHQVRWQPEPRPAGVPSLRELG